MATISELYGYLESIIPRSLSCEWDNDGLMVCSDGMREAKKVLFALDATENVAHFAVDEGFDTIITHHPMIFSPLRTLNFENAVSRRAIFLIEHSISVMSFHTRLDAACGGVNDTLAGIFGLCDVIPFGPDGEKLGRAGKLPCALSFADFLNLVKEKLRTPYVEFSGVERKISNVAILGGGGKDFISSAKETGADVFLTGEVSYNAMLDAAAEGLLTVTAGHYYTEYPVLMSLFSMVKEHFPELFLQIYPFGNEVSAV